MWMRNERIAFCSLTTAWTEAVLHTGDTKVPPHERFGLILLVSNEWCPWWSRTSTGLLFNLAHFEFPSCCIWKGRLKTSPAAYHEGRVDNCCSGGLGGKRCGFLIGSRQSKSDLKLWGMGENEQSGQAGRVAWRETSTQWVVLLKARKTERHLRSEASTYSMESSLM